MAVRKSPLQLSPIGDRLRHQICTGGTVTVKRVTSASTELVIVAGDCSAVLALRLGLIFNQLFRGFLVLRLTMSQNRPTRLPAPPPYVPLLVPQPPFGPQPIQVYGPHWIPQAVPAFTSPGFPQASSLIDVQQQLNALNQEVARLNGRTSSLEKQLEEKDKAMVDLQQQHTAQIAHLQRQHTAQIAQLQEQHTAQIAQLQEQINQMQVLHAAQITELQVQHAAQLDNLQQQLAMLQGKVEHLENVLQGEIEREVGIQGAEVSQAVRGPINLLRYLLDCPVSANDYHSKQKHSLRCSKLNSRPLRMSK